MLQILDIWCWRCDLVLRIIKKMGQLRSLGSWPEPWTKPPSEGDKRSEESRRWARRSRWGTPCPLYYSLPSPLPPPKRAAGIWLVWRCRRLLWTLKSRSLRCSARRVRSLSWCSPSESRAPGQGKASLPCLERKDLPLHPSEKEKTLSVWKWRKNKFRGWDSGKEAILLCWWCGKARRGGYPFIIGKHWLSL